MTGSGTLAIEAALIAKNIAPGTWRKFAFDNFDWFDNDDIDPSFCQRWLF